MTIGSWVQDNVVKPAIAELTKQENIDKFEALVKRVVSAEVDRAIDALGGQIDDVAKSLGDTVNSVTDNVAEEVTKSVDSVFDRLTDFLKQFKIQVPGIPGIPDIFPWGH